MPSEFMMLGVVRSKLEVLVVLDWRVGDKHLEIIRVSDDGLIAPCSTVGLGIFE